MHYLKAVRIGLIAGLSAFALAGCATTQRTQVDDTRVARLPTEARERLIDQQRAVDVAQSNLDASRAAWKDAEQFTEIVANERHAAEERLEAARKATALAAKSADHNLIENTRLTETAAGERLRAQQAKMQYAKDLVELRKAQVEEQEAQLAAAQAHWQLQRADALAVHGMATDLKRDTFVRAEAEAQQRVADEKQQVTTRRAITDASKTAWIQTRRQYDIAARRTNDVPTEAPVPPEPLD